MATVDERVYNQALKGSDVNRGLPPVLALFVTAQARHETGNYTSGLFKHQNNLFGYSYVPGGRYQLAGAGVDASGSQGATARYANIENSVKEIVDWIYRRQAEGYFPKDLSAVNLPDYYVHVLWKRGYFTDLFDNYLEGIKRALGKIVVDERIKRGLPAGLIISFLFLGYWLVSSYVRRLMKSRP